MSGRKRKAGETKGERPTKVTDVGLLLQLLGSEKVDLKKDETLIRTLKTEKRDGFSIFIPNKEYTSKKEVHIPSMLSEEERGGEEEEVSDQESRKTTNRLRTAHKRVSKVFREGMFVVMRESDGVLRIAKISSAPDEHGFMTVRVFSSPMETDTATRIVNTDNCIPSCNLHDDTFPDTEEWESLREQLMEAKSSMA